MLRVIISGIMGTMGKVVLSRCINNSQINVVAGVDLSSGSIENIPVYSSFFECEESADIVIDFSNPSNFDNLYNFCLANMIPVVICTTGFSEEQENKIKHLSQSVAVFKSANMSLGVNLLAALAKTAVSILSEEFDIEIIEKHHRRKVDAPSGTALMLAKEINAVCDNRFHYIYERESARKSREDNEIGIHSLRGGTIVGDHEIIFAGNDEVITISHSASSRNVFATGAISAALFLVSQKSGLFDMSAMINSSLG